MSFDMNSFGVDPEMAQDYFKIAPFSKKRAAFYLTQAWNELASSPACSSFKPSISMLFVLSEEKIAIVLVMI